MIKLPDIAAKHFSTRAEAKNYASAFAKKWIDDGKPGFHNDVGIESITNRGSQTLLGPGASASFGQPML